MKYLAILLDRVGENICEATDVVGQEVYEAAQKEFKALLAAGIEVKIEQVETITVVKPKPARRSYHRKAK